MNKASDAFNVPQRAIDWAKSRVVEAEKTSLRYLKDYAFTILVQDDIEAKEHVSKIRLTKPPPMEIEGLFRNALVDLKHSFDQSLYAAAQAMGCLRFDKNYPWADTRTGFMTIVEKRQLQKDSRLPEALVDELRRQEPYITESNPTSDGNLVREIAKMANDKHTIGFTASASIASMSVSNVVFQGNRLGLPGKWDPVKKEMEITRIAFGDTLSYDVPAFAAAIFFERDGLMGQIPVVLALNKFAEKAQVVLDGLKRSCS